MLRNRKGAAKAEGSCAVGVIPTRLPLHSCEASLTTLLTATPEGGIQGYRFDRTLCGLRVAVVTPNPDLTPSYRNRVGWAIPPMGVRVSRGYQGVTAKAEAIPRAKLIGGARPTL